MRQVYLALTRVNSAPLTCGYISSRTFGHGVRKSFGDKTVLDGIDSPRLTTCSPAEWSVADHPAHLIHRRRIPGEVHDPPGGARGGVGRRIAAGR